MEEDTPIRDEMFHDMLKVIKENCTILVTSVTSKLQNNLKTVTNQMPEYDYLII